MSFAKLHLVLVGVIIALGITIPRYALAMDFKHGGSESACRDKDACHGWIQASGEITASTPQEFLAFVKSSKLPYSTIRFDSSGGDLRGAIRLGMILREKNFDTEAEICASACLYAFLGGHTRTSVGKRPLLGIHRFYREKAKLNPGEKQFTGEDLDTTQRLMAGLLLYTQSMGVDLRLISLSAEAGPNEMRWLSPDEADSLKVTYAPGKWLPWQIEIPRNTNRGLVAISSTQDKSRSMQILCHEDGQAFFMLTDENNDSGWFEQCKNEPVFHPVLGTRVAPQHVQVFNNPPGIGFRIQDRNLNLSKSPSLFVRQGGSYSMACTDLSESYRGTLRGLQRMATLALSNCLGQNY